MKTPQSCWKGRENKAKVKLGYSFNLNRESLQGLLGGKVNIYQRPKSISCNSVLRSLFRLKIQFLPREASTLPVSCNWTNWETPESVTHRAVCLGNFSSWNICFQYFSSFWSLSFMFVHSHLFIALFLKKNILILFTLRSPLIHSDMTKLGPQFARTSPLQCSAVHCGNKSFSTHWLMPQHNKISLLAF